MAHAKTPSSNRAKRTAIPLKWEVVALTAITTTLAAVILAPLIPVGRYAGTGGSGYMLALRDMVITPHPYVGANAFGMGDLPARNAPQDGILALMGLVVPATWVVRALLGVGVALGAIGAAGLARRAAGSMPTSPIVRVGSQAAAITLILWNPFTAERLAQGQWSLVLAAWALPFIAHSALNQHVGWSIMGLWCASITPTGAILAAITAALCFLSTRQWRAAGLTVAAFVAVALPWLIPSLLASPYAPLDAAPPGQPGRPADQWARAMVSAFAPGPEPYVGAIGALLGLGGIWNADVVPAGRHAGRGGGGVILVGFLLISAGYAAIDQRLRTPRGRPRERAGVPGVLVWLAFLGWGYAMSAVIAPEILRGLIHAFPPAALGRDAHKAVALALPFLAAACGTVLRLGMQSPTTARGGGQGRGRAWPLVWPLVLIALAILQVPDLPRHLHGLAPVPTVYSAQQLAGMRSLPGDVLDPHARTLVSYAGRVMVDPRAKDLPLVQPGELTVDGVTVDPYSPRYREALRAYENNDRGRLAQLGVGVVLDEAEGQASTPLLIPDPHPRERWRMALGIALTLGWALVPLSLWLFNRRMSRRSH